MVRISMFLANDKCYMLGEKSTYIYVCVNNNIYRIGYITFLGFTFKVSIFFAKNLTF